jgi:PhnB protein
MAQVSTYLNFPGTTEAAFTFYKSVFGTEFAGPIVRFADMPMTPQPGQPEPSDADKRMVVNVGLPILAGHLLMGTDVMDTKQGNNVLITLHPDTRAEADALFAALAAGGTVHYPLHDAEWGDYFGHLTDRFGTNWMVNCSAKS